MALKYESTGQYFKINKELCSVTENTLSISYYTYKNKNEREREKILKPQFDTAYNSVINSMVELEKRGRDIIAALEPLYGTNVEELKANNKEFNSICETLGKANYLKDNFYNLVYSFNKEEETYKAPCELSEFNIPNEWIQNPILVSKNSYAHQQYNGEEIEYTFLYNTLKNASAEPCVNC